MGFIACLNPDPPIPTANHIGMTSRLPHERRSQVVEMGFLHSAFFRELNRNSERIPRRFCRSVVLRMLRGSSVSFPNNTPVVKTATGIILVKAGIQKDTGCPQLTTCRGRPIKLVPDLIGDPA